MKKSETISLLKQTNALGSYLDDMLHDATRLASEIIDQPVEQPIKQQLILDALSEEAAIEDAVPRHQQVTALDKTEEVELADRFSIEIEPKADVGLKEGLYSGKSFCQLDISQFPIQCLMFRVGLNLLSLPLVKMNGVLQWTDKLTRLPQSPDWVLGILKHRDTNLRVLDSSKLLGISATKGIKANHILILSDNVSAITCDNLEDVVTLEYNDIQWQPEAGNPLMYGIIRETLGYLLSPEAIIDSLNLTTEQ
jgi:chemotaxis signal transduction protein